MGCGESKAAAVKDTGKQDKYGSDEYVSVGEAEAYVKSELGVNDEKAQQIVASINRRPDGRIAKSELTDLWKKIQAKKEEVRPYFQEIDKDNSGYVTSEEAAAILKKIFNEVDDAKLKAVIRRFDDNDDGKINYNEFVIFYAHISAKREEVCKAVGQLEKDEDGAVSADDIVTLLSGHCGLDDKYARCLADDFDHNRDGKISSAEFDDLMTRLFP